MARSIVKRITSTPIGSITTMAKSTAPTGYLACNGAVVSRTTYADLFAEIGTAHGSGDGSTTFHLPDLRGRFLRGADEGAGRDPDAGTRTVPNSGGAAGDTVGSIQGEGTKNPGFGASSSSSTTDVQNMNALSYTLTGIASNGHSGMYPVIRGSGYNNAFGVNPMTFSTSTSTSITGGSTETRSINANVKYAIKY